jgi:hypothetical protein
VAQAADHLTAVIRPAVRPRPVGRLWAPTLAYVWLGLAVVSAALGAALYPIDPIDYWWSVRLGALIRQLGTIPADDPLVYTAIRGPIVDGQWLARVILSTLHDLGGVELSLALRTPIAIGVALLLARACRSAGAGQRVSAVMAGLSVSLFVPGMAVRPQLFAVVPFLLVWRAALRPPRSIVGIALTAGVVVFWANVHGSFILIYPLLGVGILEAATERLRGGSGDRLRRALILTVACGLAPLLNPYGLGLANYVADAVLFNGGATSIGVLGAEWAPPEIRSGYGGLFYGSIVLAVVLLGAGTRPRLGEGLLLLAFAVLAVSSTRHILWWSLVMVPFVARGVSTVLASPALRRLPQPGPLPAGSPGLNLACLVTFALLVTVSLPWWRQRLPLPTERTTVLDTSAPVAVGDYLATHPIEGRLFNDTDWSAYFSWRLAPDTRVFIDNRFELHPADVWKEYMTISLGQVRWQRLLDAYGVTRLALNPKSQSGLVEAVRELPDWQLVYEDRQALVFDRADR